MPSLTRRRLLAGVGVLAAAAGGAAIGALSASSSDGNSDKRGTPRPPAPLLSALDRERTLLAAVQAAAKNAALAGVTGPLVADHSQHEATLSGLLATYPKPSASAPESSSTPPAALTSVTALRQAEGAAAEEAAAESAAAHGALAAVLASISACEASHAAWLR
jgi:hypothetical protein